MMNLYQRKLYALLRTVKNNETDIRAVVQGFACFQDSTETLTHLERWWSNSGLQDHLTIYHRIASSSDRINLTTQQSDRETVPIRHLISGQPHQIDQLKQDLELLPQVIRKEPDAQKVFWWIWRFYPELLANENREALLFPAHAILPDCSIHSYQATVTALVGAISGDQPATDSAQSAHPYLLLFSFSPVQEFIKASRKFLDFWAGSYLLHYLSTRLCWHIAQVYGPDAVIVPSLWSQEIIDALLLQQYPGFENDFTTLQQGKTPIIRFGDRTSTSLSTAGFPNVITALVPGKQAAMKLGQDLIDQLKTEWYGIGEKIREDIRIRVSEYAVSTLENDQTWDAFWKEFSQRMPNANSLKAIYKKELQQYRPQISHQHDPPKTLYPTWVWNELWDAQLNHSWEPYWTAIPLGSPGELECSKQHGSFNQDWIRNQQTIAQPPQDLKLPIAEEHSFATLNVGTWWGSIQQRLRLTLQSVKNTRVWRIPAAPGERSTISGQFSAVHPFLNYTKFPEGGGLPEGSMRLFWFVMSKVYPGLFNGSERLNALELTKRMAWIYGGVADSLGIPVTKTIHRIPRHKKLLSNWQLEQAEQLLYDKFLRFPNLTSIAAARFLYDDSVRNQSRKTQLYWNLLNDEIPQRNRRLFKRLTRTRATQIPKTDQKINPGSKPPKHGYYNGVMFSNKWLAEDMNLTQEETQALRKSVEQSHTHKEVGFSQGSPADWWAIVLADGDGMGQYVSGQSLLNYEHYLNQDAIPDSFPNLNELKATKKRMGPATHVGLNRALLDFSNRLVPYLTEQRFCGKVIYSGGDDVMAVLPLEDLPEYLLSLRAAWSGKEDPCADADDNVTFRSRGGYWQPHFKTDQAKELLLDRPHFTMGKNATMSMGVIIAHTSIPLPTVLESLWTAEKDGAKKIPGKDGLCFRVIYSSGNQLEALMKGHLLEKWWNCIRNYSQYGDHLSPLLYRLAEELPRRACVTEGDRLFSRAAAVIMDRRDETKQLETNFDALQKWLDDWEDWVKETLQAKWSEDWQDHYQAALTGLSTEPLPLGTRPEELGKLLRFTAFWVDKRVERWNWVNPKSENPLDSLAEAATQ